MADIHLLKLNFKDQDFSTIVNIRKKVFTGELNIRESELFDEHDETCDHYILFDGKKSVGSIRFLKTKDEIKLERMAILTEFRGKKYGKSAISQLTEYYHMIGYSKMILDSIFSARDFYIKCGFLVEGEILQLTEYYHMLGYCKIILDSILSVKDFYKKCGFTEESEVFQRVGIDHIRMSLTL